MTTCTPTAAAASSPVADKSAHTEITAQRDPLVDVGGPSAFNGFTAARNRDTDGITIVARSMTRC
jgi:hypothetical protein